MSAKGGLPPLDPYKLMRGYWLHELRQIHAFKRVHGLKSPRSNKPYQQQLCKLRKEKYK